jgi:translocation and assembly module TamB
MRRPAKIALWSLICICALLLLVLAGVLIGANTDRGRAAIEKLTYTLTDGAVRVTGLKGSLPGHLLLDRLELVDDRGVWLSAEQIQADWSPLAYLHGRLRVDALQVAHLRMERLPHSSSQASTSQESTSDPKIPQIDVDRAAIDVLQLGAELAGAPATLAAQGSAHLRSVRDMSIEVSARRVDGDGTYDLQVQFDPRRMDAALKLHEPANGPLENILSVPGLGDLDARLNLSGLRSAEKLDLAVQAGGLTGKAHGSFDLTTLSADLDIAFDAPAMHPRADLSWQRASLHGRWHGSVQRPSADGHLDVAGLNLPGNTKLANALADINADGGAVELHAKLSGLAIPGQPQLLDGDPVKLDASMRLDQTDRPLTVTATHRLFLLHAQAATSGAESAQVDLKLLNLEPFAALAGQQVRGSADVTGKIDGYPSAPHWVVDARAQLEPGREWWSAALGAQASLQIEGSYQDHTLSLASAKLSGDALALSANGMLTGQQLKSQWSLRIAELNKLAAGVSGTAQASGSLNGPLNSLSSVMQLKTFVSVRGAPGSVIEAQAKLNGLPSAPNGSIQAHGRLDGAPLAIDVTLARGPGPAFHADIHEASWKSARASGNVTVPGGSAPAHGQVNLNVQRLSDLENLLGRKFGGSLAASVTLKPEERRTHAQFQLDGQTLTFGQLSGEVHLRGEGGLNAFVFDAGAQTPNLRGAPASLASRGVLDLDAQQVTLQTATFKYRGQDVRLLAPARVDFANGVAVDLLKLGALKAQLELQGQIAPQLGLRMALRQASPELVNAFVPGLLSGGAIEAHADIHGDASSPLGNVQVNATNLRFADDAALGLPAANFHLDGQLRGDTADLDARLDAGANSALRVNGRAPLGSNGAVDLKITGKLDAGLVNPLLEARGQHAGGQLDVDATVGGSVTDPQIGGTFNFSKGSLRDYARGVSLSDINAQFEGNAGTLQIKTFTAAAAPGTLSMSGSMGILQKGIPVDLKLTATHAQPIVSKLVTANLNADLHVSGTAREQLAIDGTLHLNRTQIGIPSALPPSVAVLDVRRRGKQAAVVADKPLIITLNIAVQAPQEIIVQGRGLDAEMGGDLKVSGTTDSPVVSGNFDLQRGSFSLSGNKLNFTAGQVSFNGAGLKNRIDPTLDFTAQSTLSDGTVATVRITGLADAPHFEFTSTPSYPQDEIMARLLFGVPGSQLSALQLAQTGYALASLSGVGGDGSLNPLVKIQKTLGLDRLTLGAGTTTTTATGTENSGASIAAGRYISKRVYIEAKQTTAGTSQLQADVDLTKHLKLQTRLGNGTASSLQGTTPDNDPGSSLGLVYTFEY